MDVYLTNVQSPLFPMEEVESRILRYISEELYNDGQIYLVCLWLAITLCIEANVLSPDTRWQFHIASALYKKKEFEKCIQCLEGCYGNQTQYFLKSVFICSILKAKCFVHLEQYREAASCLELVDVILICFRNL